MNKDVLDQIPAEEQPVASKITSLVEHMQPSQAFQWDLENQLMDKAGTPPAQSWLKRVMIPIGWALAAVFGVLLLNQAFGSILPQASPAAGTTPTEEVSFVDRVREGNICAGPLALGHGFGVFLVNPEDSQFAPVDADKTIMELRSFNWSADGEKLAIVTNSMGSGNIYLTDVSGALPQPILSSSPLGYMMDAAWSRDGERLVMWSSQNNQILYLLSADGNELSEEQLDVYILGSPQFSPNGERVLFHGSNVTSGGLFEVKLDDMQTRLLNPLVEDESGFAFSPDGSRLAYVEMDREAGEARVIAEILATGEETLLGTLPIPRGSGSSIPESANLSWSADSSFLAFDFGIYASERAIYLAQADGAGMVRLVDSAYAPSISADGKCLAYISENAVFLTDLSKTSAGSTTNRTILIGELPIGRGTPNFKQDKLQWSPGTTP